MSDSRIARRLPAIAAEIVSVVFAVLLALAVDEWWAERERQQFADRALDAIAQEIRGNRRQLLKDTVALAPAGRVAAIDSAIQAIRGGREAGDVGVNWDAALLSTAAWETARLTGATEEMPLDRVIELARLYDFQRMFAREQDALTSTILETSARVELEPVPVLLELRSRYAYAAGLRQTLATLYACGLVGLEGPDVPEAADCPGSPDG